MSVPQRKGESQAQADRRGRAVMARVDDLLELEGADEAAEGVQIARRAIAHDVLTGAIADPAEVTEAMLNSDLAKGHLLADAKRLEVGKPCEELVNVFVPREAAEPSSDLAEAFGVPPAKRPKAKGAASTEGTTAPDAGQADRDIVDAAFASVTDGDE
jgi:hypothetical protein